MRDVRISGPEILSTTLDIAKSRGSSILSVIHLHRPHPTVCFQTFDKDGSGTIDEVNLVGELAQRLAWIGITNKRSQCRGRVYLGRWLAD